MQILVDCVYNYLVNGNNMNEKLMEVNSSYNIDIKLSDIIKLFEEDSILFEYMLRYGKAEREVNLTKLCFVRLTIHETI